MSLRCRLVFVSGFGYALGLLVDLRHESEFLISYSVDQADILSGRDSSTAFDQLAPVK